MDNALYLCEDGSHTLFSEKTGECYHSIHGAYTESLHIFIQAGLQAAFESVALMDNVCDNNQIVMFGDGTVDNQSIYPDSGMLNNIKPVRILEIGFGTGLNALLSVIEAEKQKISVSYLGLEPFPVRLPLIQQLNYCQLLAGKSSVFFAVMHDGAWDTTHMIHSCFSFKKQKTEFIDAELKTNSFDLIYFDAFSPEAQPDLWEPAVFEKCYQILAKNGILVTYCAKGRVKRALKSAGFIIENLPGPPGKREITRARKLV